MKKFGIMLCILMLVLGACSSSKVASGKLSEVHEAVKAAYGEAYLPSMPMEKAYLTEVMGVAADDIREFIAEGPMMSAHVDMFIGVEAASGKGAAVEEAFKAYLDGQLENMLMYPMNVPKMQTAKVVRVEDYVFFLCLGAYAEDDTLDEAGLVSYYEGQVAIGEKAIHDTLGK